MFQHNSGVEEVADPVRRFRPYRSLHAFRRQLTVILSGTSLAFLFSHMDCIQHVLFFLTQVLTT
jgi:hypothetical protein